jgi:XTP/dITP diphosphohydrolase
MVNLLVILLFKKTSGGCMKTQNILMATSNKGKTAEIKRMFESFDINFLSLLNFPEITQPEEDGKSFYDNALIKAKYYFEKTGLPALADDSGLVVYSLDNMPGIYSARYAGENATDDKNTEKLLKTLENTDDRKAAFVCSIVLYFSKDKIISSEGRVEGHITCEKKGENGFGYDPVFVPDNFTKTMAELSMDVKNKISHRAKALNILLKKLAGINNLKA